MDECDDDVSHCSTEWALLFPLRAGLFSLKSSVVSLEADRKMTSGAASLMGSTEELAPRLRLRRRSSMSDLDKIAGLKAEPPRSATSHSYDSTRGSIGDFMNYKRFGGSGCRLGDSTLARTMPLSTVTTRSREEFSGYASNDSLPRARKFGFVLSENLLMQYAGAQNSSYLEDVDGEDTGPLTGSQRTERLSRIIRQQRSSHPDVSFTFFIKSSSTKFPL